MLIQRIQFVMVEIDNTLNELEDIYRFIGGAERFQIWHRASGLSDQRRGPEGPDEVLMYLTEDAEGMDTALNRSSGAAELMVADFFHEMENHQFLDEFTIMDDGEFNVFREELKERTERGIGNLFYSDAIDFRVSESDLKQKKLEEQEEAQVITPLTLRAIGDIYGTLGHENNLAAVYTLNEGRALEDLREEGLTDSQILGSRDVLETSGFIEQRGSSYELTETGKAAYEELVPGSEGDYEWLKSFDDWYQQKEES
jgi:hypothetical protein